MRASGFGPAFSSLRWGVVRHPSFSEYIPGRGHFLLSVLMVDYAEKVRHYPKPILCLVDRPAHPLLPPFVTLNFLYDTS